MIELSHKSNERSAALVDFESALRVPVGAASPLWFMFAGAASAGVAYWWMARWSKPENLEALLAARPDASLALPAPEAVVEPAIEAMTEAMQAMTEAVVEALEPSLDPEAETDALEAAIFASEPQSAPAAEAELPAEAAPREPAGEAPKPAAAKKATSKAKSAAAPPEADS